MFGRHNRRKQLQVEFEQHIEWETEANIAAGMSPADARSAALRRFGNLLRTREDSESVWGFGWLESIAHDVRYSLRRLNASRSYTATLVGTLTLGLGAVATVLAVSDSTLLEPVALPHPEQLMQVYSADEVSGMHTSANALTYTVFTALAQNGTSFSSVCAYNTLVRPVSVGHNARVTPLAEVTESFFNTLGMPARLGRALEAGDARQPVAVVSDEFWRERLNRSRSSIGSQLRVGGETRTIVGVMPRGFHAPFVMGTSAVYIPLAVDSSGKDELLMESAAVIARNRDGVDKAQALAEARAIFARTKKGEGERYRRLELRPYREFLVGDLQTPLFALLGGVAVLLAIACANAANLQIGRAVARSSEMQTRAALGASWGRLLQSLLTETLLVSLAGGLGGTALAWAATEAIRYQFGNSFTRFDELTIHPVVVLWMCLLTILVGIAASTAPMFTLRRQTRNLGSTRSTTASSRLPSLLVAAQAALTCVLLVVTGMFWRTLQSLEQVKLGIDPTNVTTLVLLPEKQNGNPETSRALTTALLHRFESLGGVQAVTLESSVPFSSFNVGMNGTTEVAGRPFVKGDNAFYSLVSRDFVHTSRIRLLYGRGLRAGDENGAAIRVLVNAKFRDRYLQYRDPLGATLHFHRNPGDTDADLPFTQGMTVVGVVENEIQGGDLGAPYQPMVYLNYLALPTTSFLGQVFNMSAQFAIRSQLDEATLAKELRAAIKAEAPSMVEMSLKRMSDSVAESLGTRRLALQLVGCFGAVALLLSAVGIYGVLAYAVALRRREIGIRMTLGSTRGEAAQLMWKGAGQMALLGLVPGLLAAWLAAHAVRSFLFGIGPFDIPSTLGAALLLLLVFAAAATIPALRAANVDPAETLRQE